MLYPYPPPSTVKVQLPSLSLPFHIREVTKDNRNENKDILNNIY